MPLTISRTGPFRRLQSKIGLSTYRLNTVLVGLECVADGNGDAGSLAVTWSKPPPDKARQVADQARIFACSAAMALGVDVFDSFLREFALEEWLGFKPSTQNIVTKSVTRTKDDGGDYSVAERARALCDDLQLESPVSLAALDLFAKWRNVVVHGTNRSVRIEPEARQTLVDAAADINDKYSHLDVVLALRNFEDRKTPVPKEVTTLIAIAVNLSRKMDEEAIKRAASDGGKIVSSAEQMLRVYFRSKAGRTPSPWSEVSEAWQGKAARRAKMLEKFLANVGITKSKSPVSAPLPEDYFEELVSLTREQFASRFLIEIPTAKS